jgi:hypothetical protein
MFVRIAPFGKDEGGGMKDEKSQRSKFKSPGSGKGSRSIRDNL